MTVQKFFNPSMECKRDKKGTVLDVDIIHKLLLITYLVIIVQNSVTLYTKGTI